MKSAYFPIEYQNKQYHFHHFIPYHAFSDHVNDLPMEIGPNFLPLPVIQIPREDIALRVPLYEVIFSK